MCRYKDRGIDALSGEEIYALTCKYVEFIKDRKVVNDEQNEIKFLNNMGLFNREEGKEYLNEQSDTDRESD